MGGVQGHRPGQRKMPCMLAAGWDQQAWGVGVGSVAVWAGPNPAGSARRVQCGRAIEVSPQSSRLHSLPSHGVRLAGDGECLSRPPCRPLSRGSGSARSDSPSTWL